MTDTLTLYCGSRNASSWSFRAWLALRLAGLTFEERIVDMRLPQRVEGLAPLADFSPPATVPVLIAGDRSIFDSLAIMEFANEAAFGALLPSGTIERAEARSLIGWQHAGLSRICARVSFESSFFPAKRRLSVTELAEARRFLGAVEGFLDRSGGPFLFGPMGLADVALAPTAVRLARHDADVTRTSSGAAWIDGILAHPLVAEWVDSADRLEPVWDDNYLLPCADTEPQLQA